MQFNTRQLILFVFNVITKLYILYFIFQIKFLFLLIFILNNNAICLFVPSFLKISFVLQKNTFLYNIYVLQCFVSDMPEPHKFKYPRIPKKGPPLANKSSSDEPTNCMTIAKKAHLYVLPIYRVLRQVFIKKISKKQVGPIGFKTPTFKLCSLPFISLQQISILLFVHLN